MLIPWRVYRLQTLQSRGVPMVQDGDEANAPGAQLVTTDLCEVKRWQFGSLFFVYFDIHIWKKCLI